MRAALLLGALAGCAAESRHDVGVGRVDTLPSGTVVVHNTAQGAWDSTSTWRLVEDLRIGSAGGEPQAEFSRITALAVDAQGRVYVLDRQSQEVRVFDTTGRYVRTIGRKGRGPGEFTGADGIIVDPLGNLWVADRSADRLSAFDTSGALLADYRRARPGLVPTLLGGGADGTVWDAWRVVDPGADKPHTELIRFADGRDRDTLRFAPFEPPQWRITTRQGNVVSRFDFPVPFTARELLTTDAAGGVWRAISSDYRLTRFTAPGDSTLVVTREYTPVGVTAGDRERMLSRYRKTFSESHTELDEGLVPEYQPAIHGMFGDDRGNIWVMPVTGDTTDLSVDVFDPTGGYLGSVRTRLSPRMLVPQPVVRAGSLYYVTTDTLDVPYVIRAHIQGRN